MSKVYVFCGQYGEEHSNGKVFTLVPQVAVDRSLTLTGKAEEPRTSTYTAHDPATFLVEQTREVTPE